VEVALEMKILQGGRIVRGCTQGEGNVRTFIPHLIELHRAGRLPVDRLVRHYPHADINEAVADMAAGRTIKAVLQLGQEVADRRPPGRAAARSDRRTSDPRRCRPSSM
jgi:Zn-dependent alcohol dehydrogenase